MMKSFNSLFDLMDAFPDEQSCVDHLRSIRWANGEFCPHCGATRIMHFADKRTFKCSDCRQRFSIKVGTIFQDTKLPLRKWFMAIWLITNHPKGVASTTLAKDLSITQKSAWFVLHRLRHAARTQSFAAPLNDTVEADTTFVGGKEKNKHANKKTPGSQGGANKAVVLGMIQRDGELRTEHVADSKAKTLQGSIRHERNRERVGAPQAPNLRHPPLGVGQAPQALSCRDDVALQSPRGQGHRPHERPVRVRRGSDALQGADGMTEKQRKTEPPLKLDMEFGEALARFAAVDPKQVAESVERAKTKKPPEDDPGRPERLKRRSVRRP